jgi:hypothetical protein
MSARRRGVPKQQFLLSEDQTVLVVKPQRKTDTPTVYERSVAAAEVN